MFVQFHKWIPHQKLMTNIFLVKIFSIFKGHIEILKQDID